MTTSPQVMVKPRTLTRSAAQAPAARGQIFASAALFGLAVLTLAGCSTSVTGTKDSILPRNLKSMDEIYKEHTQGKYRNPQTPTSRDTKGATPQSAAPPARGNETRQDNLRPASWSYTRSASMEIDNLFPTLPNPMLVMHVFAHLSGTENTPVPGYATAFPLYERVEFALPGELEYQHADIAGGRPPPEDLPADPLRPAAVVTITAPPGALMTTSTPPELVKTTTNDPSAP